MANPTPTGLRLRELRRYDVLDTPPEPEFDEVTRLIAEICDVPIAMVSLVADEYQFMKSHHGTDLERTPIDFSFCRHAIEHDEMMIVDDVRTDARFETNPFVQGEPHVAFYAGAVLRTPAGVPIGTLCVFDDEPRELEEFQIHTLRVLARHVTTLLELRRRMREVDEALETRKRLLATVSHDLRGPIGNVAMTAQLLKAEGSQDHGARLERSAATMKRLVDDLLDFDRAESGDLDIRPRLFDVRELLETTRASTELRAQAREVRIVVQVPESPLEVWGDDGRLEQVLDNLVGNAVRYAPPDSSIVLSAEATEESVRFAVADQGPGVDSELAHKLFLPYWRGQESEEGMGLGLSIARRLVEAHDGEIWLDPHVREGARFVFEVPRRPPPRRDS